MPAQFLIRHWKKELQVFHKNLLLLQNGFSPQAIHDLRVAIKKLRSYFRIYTSILVKNNPAVFSPTTKKLFSVLGHQRNIEMSIELLQKANNDNKSQALKKFLMFSLEETKHASSNILKHYDTNELKNQTIEIERNSIQVEDEKTKKEFLKLLKISLTNVKKLSGNFDKNYHLARKKLKDIFYWSEILPEDFYFKKQELKNIKTILDHLGDAQDLVIFKTNLKYFRKTFLLKGNEEYESAKRLQTKIDEEKKNCLEKAKEGIDRLFK